MIIKECRVCGSSNLVDVLDLGLQPWCNDYTETDGRYSQRYPLVACFCESCSTFQIRHTVPKEIMYNNHTYLSGSNKSMPDHFLRVAKSTIGKKVGDVRLVVDIGSNDGTLLKQFESLGLNVLGVEPCASAASVAIESGVPTMVDYFSSGTARNIASTHGKADIISAANVFYHVEELHDIVDGVKDLLQDDGVFVVQGTYLPSLLAGNEFDIIYHEHLLYYRIENLNTLLAMHGLEIFDVELADVHGGSFIAYVSHKNSKKISSHVSDLIAEEREMKLHQVAPYLEFRDRVLELRQAIRSQLFSLKERGKSIYAYGAPAKGTVMINFCGLDCDVISLAVEVNPEKIGTYIPGTSIAVLDENLVEEPDYYFVLSWNFISDFMKKDPYLTGIRTFINPIPYPKLLNSQGRKP